MLNPQVGKFGTVLLFLKIYVRIFFNFVSINVNFNYYLFRPDILSTVLLLCKHSFNPT